MKLLLSYLFSTFFWVVLLVLIFLRTISFITKMVIKEFNLIQRIKIKNIHPVNIDPNSIEGALKLVITTFGGKPQPLFPDDKVFDYSVAISEALLEAKPNEDVVFTIEGWYKQKGLSANKVTSGRIFYNKSGLHLIFGSILRKGNMLKQTRCLAMESILI